MLIEAAKIAPHWNPQLAAVHERELRKGNRHTPNFAAPRKWAPGAALGQSDLLLTVNPNWKVMT
jgi:hypothetical protein